MPAPESTTRRHYRRQFVGGQYVRRPEPKPVYIKPLSLEALRRLGRHNALDPRLEPANLHMLRWACSHTDCSYPGLTQLRLQADPIGSKRSFLPPLDDDEAVITDMIVMHSPKSMGWFVMLWYRSAKSVPEIAETLAMSRTALYEERRMVLAYLLGRLTEAGLRIVELTL